MAEWIYDGTFNGFLCLIHETAKTREFPGSIRTFQGEEQSFLFPAKIAERNDLLAAAVRDVLQQRLSPRVFSAGYFAFLSSEKEREMAVYSYFSLVWQRGVSADRLLTDSRVAAVHEARRAVSRERHRYLGLLRFSDISGVLYARFTPEADVLPLIAGHFAVRLAQERWIIHDTGRNRAALYDSGTWCITDFRHPGVISLSAGEKAVQELWKRYFTSTAVRTRENRRLQQHFMPKKYWKYLPEKDPSEEL